MAARSIRRTDPRRGGRHRAAPRPARRSVRLYGARGSASVPVQTSRPHGAPWHERLPRSARSRLRAPRRRGALGQRRLLRAEGEPPQAARARVPRARVHRPRQMDGRLGVAPPPHARPRRRDRPPRRSPASSAAWWWTPRSSAATTPITAPSRPAPPAPTPPSTSCSAPPRAGWRCCPGRRSGATRRTSSRSTRPTGSRTSGSTSSRTAASPACACTATSSPTGEGSAGAGPRSISPPRRTAAGCSRAATCSSACATT